MRLNAIRLVLSFFVFPLVAQAQWTTQQVPLNPGWNAVYFYVQPEPRLLNTVFSNLPVDSVRHWHRQEAGIQFDVDPGNPFPRPGDWESWFPAGSDQQYLSTFGDLMANEAYFIHVPTNASAYILYLKGTPVLNSYTWPGNAYSLYGLPVASSASRTFSEFFSGSEDIPTTYGAGSHIYSVSPAGFEYTVFQPNIQTITRGQAYWILCNELSIYAGPVSLTIDGEASGWLDFGDSTSAKELRIRNGTNGTRRIVLTRQTSESAPSGTNYSAVAGAVPLVYGVMNWDPDNLGIEYLPLPAVLTNTLAPGAELQLSIRPDPSAITNPAPNAVYQSILMMTDLDSQDRSFVSQSMGVRFVASPQAVGDPEGLWAGDILVTGVNRARIGGFATNWDTEVVSPVTRPFKFRVIFEVDSNRVAKLLQQAFVAWLPTTQSSVPGMDGSYLSGSNVILHTLAEANAFVLAHPEGNVNRISAINFPFMNPLTLSGTFGTTNAASFTMSYADTVNPFVHLYSPDSDNTEYYNGQPTALPAGVESYDITRSLSFFFSSTDLSSNRPPDWGISQWGGTYTETVDGLLTTGALIRTEGVFVIQKISEPN